MVLFESPNGESFDVVLGVSKPIILAVTVKLSTLLRRHFVDQGVDSIVQVVPISLDEEIENLKGIICFLVNFFQHLSLICKLLISNIWNLRYSLHNFEWKIVEQRFFNLELSFIGNHLNMHIRESFFVKCEEFIYIYNMVLIMTYRDRISCTGSTIIDIELIAWFLPSMSC